MKTITIKLIAVILSAFAVGCTCNNSLFCNDTCSKSEDIVFENDSCRFVIGSDARPKSLKVKPSGEELLDVSEGLPLFSVTQDRPFNNELKLVFPNEQTTYQAKSVRREGEFLIVDFEYVTYSAKIRVVNSSCYLRFELVDFILGPKGTDQLEMTYPPVKSMRIVNLPVRLRGRSGGWMNVEWNDDAAVSLMGTEPYTWVGSEMRSSVRHLYADAHRNLKLRGASAAIVASSTPSFLDSVDVMERELDLPRGVECRRNPKLKSSMYWSPSVNPKNVDRHIEMAKKGGFKMMLLYYCSVVKGAQGDDGYPGIADYEPRDEFVNGVDSIAEMLKKIKAAGITPGLHVLHTFIGFKTRYITPVADPRLSLTRHFTLAKPLDLKGGDLYVFEDPSNCPTNTKSRVLAFGGELISYEGYTTERPYKFTGVKRGYLKTKVVEHPYGQIGGILDVCEYGAHSCYIDQNTDLQDEVAEEIARIYNAGFEFMYCDGSEGVTVPQGIHVPNAQYRVWKKMEKKPIFIEGAAKGQFGWHHQAGGNAFDIFPPEIFKAMIVRWPQYEAPIMLNDFTRVDFGWWGIYLPGQKVKLTDRAPFRWVKSIGTQYDMWEFGTSRAAAWDCPISIQMNPDRIKAHPRGDDLMEVIRRWEDVREKNWLSAAQKEALKSATQEHHLYLNEKGEYELFEMEMLPAPEKAPNTRAFIFERGGRRMIAYWHMNASAKLAVNLGEAKTVPLCNLRYLETSLSLADAKSAWAKAEEK